jgi:hypothetical protein
MVAHDDDFYTRKDSKITTLPKLTGRVSKCVQAFSLDWFPDEEKSVVHSSSILAAISLFERFKLLSRSSKAVTMPLLLSVV